MGARLGKPSVLPSYREFSVRYSDTDIKCTESYPTMQEGVTLILLEHAYIIDIKTVAAL